MESSTTEHRRRSAFRITTDGLRKGAWSTLWVCRLIVPISFGTMLLEWSQVLDRFDGVLAPVMGVLSLPANAALPLLVGVLSSIYGAIAAMSVMAFTVKEATLIAVFLLISHSLVQESAIQGKAGIHPVRITLYRLAASVIVVAFLGWAWTGGGDMLPTRAPIAQDATFGVTLGDWGIQTVYLCLQILAILLVIMTAIEWMKATGLSLRLATALAPVLKLLGLDGRAGLLWLTAGIFGITYGAAVMVEETRDTELPPEVLERLHLSLGINHAMIEDPALFLPLGIGAFWLWVPRLIAAVIAVPILRLYRYWRPLNPKTAPATPQATSLPTG